MKRTLVITVFIFFVLLAGVVIYFGSQKYDVVIREDQINDALLAKFPISKSHLKIFHVNYSNPKVTLLPDSNRIQISLDAELEIKIREESKKFSGTAIAMAGIGYRYESKQFFLSNPELKKLNIQGIPRQYMDKVATLLSNTAHEHLQEITVYTLKATDVKTTAAKLLLKDVQVKSKEVHVTLGL